MESRDIAPACMCIYVFVVPYIVVLEKPKTTQVEISPKFFKSWQGFCILAETGRFLFFFK